MTSGHEVQVKLCTAKDLKNVNWRHGPVKPYAVVWADPITKLSTRADEEGDTSPEWDETLTVPLSGPVDQNTMLFIDIVHAGSESDTKKLIGSARLRLRDIIDDVGFDERASRTLQLKRPSGRPQGKLDVKVTVKEPRYRAPEPRYAAYGVPPASPAYSHPYAAPPPPPAAYGGSYNGPPQPSPWGPSFPAPPPPQPAGYPYNAAQPPASAYSEPNYGQPNFVQVSYGQEEHKKNKFGGMGTGLAVGAVAGALGAFALSEAVDHIEDKIAEDVAEKVTDDLRYWDGDDF